VRDTALGVAPGADWIAAVAGLASDTTSIFDAYDWAANPDGNINTTDDIPDAISCSWHLLGFASICTTVLDQTVDAVEALGIVNVFIAHNKFQEEPPKNWILRPGNRADDGVTNFAVGALGPT